MCSLASIVTKSAQVSPSEACDTRGHVFGGLPNHGEHAREGYMLGLLADRNAFNKECCLVWQKK